MRSIRATSLTFAVFSAVCAMSLCAQENMPKVLATPGPMLNAGVTTLSTPQFTLALVKSSQTVAALKPKNFIHVVFDNEVYGSTGNQPTISRTIRLEQMAKAAGYANVERVIEREDLVYEFKDMLKKDGPSFLLVKVTEQAEDVDRVMIEPPDMTRRFSKAIE